MNEVVISAYQVVFFGDRSLNLVDVIKVENEYSHCF